MKEKLLRILSTMIIIVGTLGNNLSPVIAMAVENEAEANSGEPTNIVKIIDQSLEDCRRILEGEATFQLPLEEKEPIDLVVIQDASGSFTENFPKVETAICDIVSKLSDQDRVMLTTYQGGQYYQLANGTVIDNSRYDIPTKVSTVTPLTFDKEAFMQGYGTVTTKGTTPTALGLQEALSTYNKTHGDLTNRKTYFLLITDGVANVQLDGKVHKTNNTLNEYPAGQQGGVSVEYSSDYKAAAAEVLKLNNEVKDNGYVMINAFWESLEALSSPNSYYNRYKEVGAYVKDQLKAGADGPENYIVSNSIDDFTEQIKHLFDEKIAQVPDSTATLTIDDKFDIRSAVAVGEDGNELPTQINNQKISVTVPGNYSGEVKIKYELKENAPIDEETTVSTGVVVQGESQKELPVATIEKNEHAHDCDIPPVEPSIEKDVEGKEHVDLGNRTDEFNWHVKAIFGNDTSKWTQASMTDEINSVLEIKNVVVKDETGADVTANGDLSIKDNKIVFTLNKQDDSYSYLSGHEYTMTITTVIRADATDAELAPYIKDGGIPNQGDLNFGNKGDVIHSNKPTVTPPPVTPSIEKDVEGKEHVDLGNRTDEFNWHVKATFGNDTSKWTQASMTDEINSVLEIKNVVVKDETGADVTANGDLSIKDNKIVFTLNKQDDSYSYLSGHEYTMTITTVIRADATDAELAPYIKDGGIPNQGDLNFGNKGDVIHSNKPTVTPPPVTPSIEKDVEGKEHVDLGNRTDEFNWHVKAIFGNDTSKWTQASMTDEINSVLEIKNVVVKDETGADVTANGDLSIKDNKIVFTLNKQDDSYSYLSGHEYTMTITTVIRADATDAELAPYIKDGGIPNQGDLNFGNKGDVIHSNKPTVTPPPVTPSIEKDVEGKEHVDLGNRTDEFNWHVKATFGNDTSKWTQASMTDEINSVLEIKNVVVKDETGADVTANGDLSIKDNKIVFTLNKQDDSYSYLSGHEYTMTITTVIRADATDAELAPYIKDGGIPNQGDLNFGNKGDVVHSNKPTVTPPPVTPSIEKDVEGQKHIALNNRADEFDWHVKATFGNDTSKWTQASITDEINSILEIKKVVVKDETGADVTKSGKVTIKDNKIVFTMNKQDDSYGYLSGHAYTMTITTVIRADATDAELFPYIKGGGIPNQGDLNFGNKGDVVHSNKPTVTPPNFKIVKKQNYTGLPKMNELINNKFIWVGMILSLIAVVVLIKKRKEN